MEQDLLLLEYDEVERCLEYIKRQIKPLIYRCDKYSIEQSNYLFDKQLKEAKTLVYYTIDIRVKYGVIDRINDYYMC